MSNGLFVILSSSHVFVIPFCLGLLVTVPAPPHYYALYFPLYLGVEVEDSCGLGGSAASPYRRGCRGLRSPVHSRSAERQGDIVPNLFRPLCFFCLPALCLIHSFSHIRTMLFPSTLGVFTPPHSVVLLSTSGYLHLT